MSRMLRTVACAAMLAVAPLAAQASTLVNGGFEGGLTGWTADTGLVQTPGVFYQRDADNNAVLPGYDPVEGWLFAAIQADQPDTPVLLSQSFWTSGGVFSGWAAFVGEDIEGFDDYGFVRIFDAATSQTLFSTGIAALGDYGATPWTFFSVDLAPGTYTIEAGVANGFDDVNPSFLLVDGFAMADVPEPAAWALMLAGFFGAGAALRRRRQSVLMALSKA